MRLSTSAASRRKRRHVLSVASVAAAQAAAPLAMMGLFSQQAEAAPLYWDVNGTTAGFSTVVGAWNDTNAFWNTDVSGGAGTLNAITTAADDLTIKQATTNTGSITLSGANKLASSITFASNVGPTTTITAGTITIGGTGASSGIFQQSTGANTVATPLTLRAASTAVNFSNSSTGLLTISGTVTGAATTGTQTITVGSSGTGGITLSGVIGNGTAGGNVALVINSAGTGVVSLNGANTFTGPVTLTNGQLNLNINGTAGTNGPLGNGNTFNINGGTLVNTSGAARAIANINPIVVGGNFAFNLANNLTLPGTVNLGTSVRTITGTGAGIFTLSGVVSGTGGGITLGGGTLTLSGANTYTGATTLNAGTLNINSATALGAAAGVFTINGGTINNSTAAAITISNAKAQSWAGDFAFTGTSGLNLGTGAVTLTASRTITANANTLTVGGAISGATFGITKAGLGTLALSGTNTYGGGTTVNAGALTFLNTNAKSTSGTHAFAAGATLGLGVSGASAFTSADIDNAFAGSMTGSLLGITIAPTSNIGIDTTNGNFTYASIVPATTTSGLTKLGVNTLTLSGASTYTTPTSIVNGTLSVASLNSVVGGTASSNLGAPTTIGNGTISLGSTNTTGILSYTGGGETTDRVINLAGTTGGGGIDNSGTGTLAFSSPMTFTGVGTKTLTVSGVSNTTFGAGVAGGAVGVVGNGLLTIAKTGTGTLLLGATGSTVNTNTATILTISGGTVDIGTSGLTLSNTGGQVITSTANATIDGTGGGVLTISSGTALDGGNIQPSANTTLTINAKVNTSTANGAFWTGAGGALELNGAGTLVLTNTNTIAGVTSITTANGTISVGSIANNLGGTTGFLFSAATGTRLLYTGTGETTAVPIQTSATATTAFVEQAGLSGTLNFSANWATGGIAKTVTLQGSTAGLGEMSGIISDNTTAFTTGITKAGTGTWTLSGANTYTGATTVNAGNLKLAAPGTLGNTLVTINSGGTFSPAAGRTIGNTATAAAGGRLTLAPGGVLNLADGTIGNLNLVQNGTFAGNAVNFNGGAILFDVGATSDQIDVLLNNVTGTGLATSTGSNSIAINPLAGFGPGSYTLINAAGTLNNSNFYLASNVVNFGGTPYSLALSQSGTNEVLTVSTFVNSSPASAFWNSTSNASWSSQPGGAGTATNWVAAASAGPDTFSLPGSTTNVVFTSNAATNLSTTLDAAYTINSLTFTGTGTANTAGSTIAAGTGGPLTINAAAVNGNTLGNGITVAAGSGTNTISANIVLGANQTWTNNATNPLVITGAVSGTGLTLTTAGAGFIQIGSGGTTGSIATDVALVTNGNLAFNRSNTVTQGTDFAATISGTGIVTQAGSGTLVLSGANTYTGNTNVTAGTLNIVGTGSITGLPASSKINIAPAAGNAIVNYTSSGTTTLFAITGATVAGTASAYNQSAGLVVITPNVTTGTQSVVGGTGAYGFYNITGGILRDTTGTTGGSRFTMGNQGTASATNGTGIGVQTSVLYVGGTGFVDHTNAEWWLNYSLGEITVTDSGKIDHTGSNNPFGIYLNPVAGNVGGAYGVLNVAGNGAQVLTGAQPFRYGNSTTANNGDGNSGFINVAAGVLSTGAIASTSLPAAPTSLNYAYYNYAGGTVRASAALATGWTPASSASISFINTIYGPVNNNAGALTGSGAPSFNGGLTIDTSGNSVTLPAAQPLLGATGQGVTQNDLAVSGGSGYIGAPAVYFSKPASATGVPAAGYALMSGGSVVGIVITNPGVYGATDAVTVTLIGGGTNTPATVTVPGITLPTSNTSGGLTKTGLGTLTLANPASTYTGGVAINQGTLALGANSAIPTANNVVVSGTGALDVATFTNTVNGVSLQSGAITGSTGVLTSTTNYDLRSGTVNFTGTGGLAGAVGLNKTTGGTVTLSGATNVNSFTGPVNVSGGTLGFATSGNLGDASATNTLSVSGGSTLQYTNSTAVNLGANRVLTIGTGGATLEATQSTGALTVQSIAAASTGNLTKTGLGTVIIPGTSSWNSGASSVIVSNGTLRTGFGTGGIAALTVGGTGFMDFTNSATEALTLGNTAGALTLNGGARLKFELGAPGTNDSITLGATGSAVTSGGVITLDFANLGGLANGTYNLLTDTTGAGLLTGGVTYALGAAPAGFNYTINSSAALVSLTVVPYVPAHWTGSQATSSWATLNAGPLSNFSTDLAGLTNTAALPGSLDTVIFSATSAVNTLGAITTTLDGSYTLDGLQFINAPTTPAVTTVAINQGIGSGTLTLAPSSVSSGIFVDADGGAVTINAPVVASTAQTWNIHGTGASSLTIGGANASVAFNAAVTKSGAGVLTLSSANTGAGAFNLMGGTLNINSATAIGTGTFSIGAGTTIDSTVAATTLTTNNVQNWNGSFTFTGTQDLNLGTGAVTLGNNLTVTSATAGKTLTVGGAISGTGIALTKAGPGTLILNGNNSYTGLTTVNAGVLTLGGANTGAGGVTLSAGTLNINNAAALGTGTLTIAAGTTIDNTSGAAIPTSTNNNVQNWNGSFTFTGSNNLNLGTGAVTLASTSNPTITLTAGTLTVGGNISGASGLGITGGTGVLLLSGNNSYTGTTTIGGGTLRLGSATALPTAGAVTMSGTGTLDLFGNSATIGAFTSVAGNTVTNTSTSTSPSTATTAGTPSGGSVYVDALVVTPVTAAAVPALITDGATRKTQIILSNNLLSTQVTGNAANTFSGGLVLAHNPVGTRLAVGTITGTPWGTGPIIIGQTATDRAGIFFNTTAQTMANPIVFNTGLGNDRFGIRTDVAATTLSGTITANVDAVFSSNNAANSPVINLTNQVTGVGGLVLDLSQTTTANTVLTVTLNNGTANPSNYQGDTVVGRTNATPAQNYTATLALGAANQIPNGVGTGNVVLNNNTATRTGILNLAGFNETINGLSGNGFLDGATTGTPTNVLTLGDNNATGQTFSGVIRNTAGSLAVTKIGTGTQTFSGANTFNGATVVSAGILNLTNSLALQNSPLDTLNSIAGDATNGLQTGVPTLTFGGLTGNKNLATVFATGGNYNTVTGVTLNPGTGAIPSYSGSITNGAAITTLTKTGAGTQTLTGNNTYSGATSITAGVLEISAANNIGDSSVTNTINLGPGTLLSSANTYSLGTNRNVSLTGAGVVQVAAGALTIDGIISNTGSLTVTGAGTLNLTGANTHSGNTIVLNGTLGGILNANSTQALGNNTSTLVMGNTAGLSGTVNVNENNSVTGLTVNTLTTVATPNTITIAPSKTLTVTGNVTIGTVATAAAQLTNLVIGGGGSLVQTSTGGTFQVGGSTAGTGLALNSTLNLTGLSAVTLNLGATGTVRVNQPTGTNVAGNQSSLLLPTPVVALNTPVTTITSNVFNVGDNGGLGGAAGQVNSVTLGTGLTTLNVNTVNVGTGGRDYGQITYAAGNGTFKLRAADGTSRAAVNIGTGAAATGVGTPAGVTNNVDFTGHSADLLVGTLAIGAQNRLVNRADSLTIDTGTLDATTVVIGTNTGTASTAAGTFTPTWTSSLNLAGTANTVIGSGGVDIGFGQTAAVSGSQVGTKTIIGNLNVSGGTVTVANNTTFAAAIRMSNSTIASSLVANSNFNITGGSVTLGGDIIKGSSTGTGTATLTLNGGLLDMGGNRIGGSVAASNLSTLNFLSGTLQNVLEINNGAGLTKTTAGVLTLAGTNSYTGGTALTAGQLNINSATALGAAASTLVISSGTTIDNTSAAALTVTNNNPQSWLGDFTFTGTRDLNLGTGAVAMTGSSTVTVTANTLTVGGNITGVGLAKAGAGRLTLTGASTYTGATTITGGTLQVGQGGVGSLAATAVTVNANATLAGSGSIAGPITTAALGHIAPGDAGLPGDLSTAGVVTLADTTTLDYHMSAPNGGVADPLGDILKVANSAAVSTVAAVPTINLNVLSGDLNPGKYDLIDYVVDDGPVATNIGAGWSLTFNGTPFGVNGTDYTFGQDQGSIYLNVINAIPEPTSVGLLAMAGLGLLARRRRNRSH